MKERMITVNPKVYRRLIIVVVMLFTIVIAGCSSETVLSSSAKRFPDNPNRGVHYENRELREIWLAGGCFWDVEAYLSRIYGVAEVTVGYANGTKENPSYAEVSSGNTGHSETAYVRYDPERVDLKTLLEYYVKIIDPTLLNRQGNDAGPQYRTGIYYQDENDLPVIKAVMEDLHLKNEKPIMIEVLALSSYYEAEDYHQDYLEKNPNGYSHIDFSPLKEQHLVYVDPTLYTKPEDSALRTMLTKTQYAVTQQDATEPSFNNEYWDNHEPGLYVDVVTGEPLFSSADKFDSGTGWPSFTKPLAPDVTTFLQDRTLGMQRNEVRSRVGNSHLGHVFNDGPIDQGGLRYCINSAAIRFIALVDLEKEGYGKFTLLLQ